jgi:hypothetical protein
MPAAKFFVRLDLNQIILFLDEHWIVPIQKWPICPISALHSKFYLRVLTHPCQPKRWLPMDDNGDELENDDSMEDDEMQAEHEDQDAEDDAILHEKGTSLPRDNI